MSQWCAHEASIAHRARATQVTQQVDNAAATPTFADQEVYPQSSTRVLYWEGSVVAAGSAGGRAVLGIAIVAAISKRLARPVPGLGIALPAFIPPILSALMALLLAPAQAPMMAYISGTFGVLIGADLLNLRNLAGLRAPVVSIGGAGTFDGIFLTGIIAVLLA
jgi:hypothetical protein